MVEVDRFLADKFQKEIDKLTQRCTQLERELERERRLFSGGPTVVFRWVAKEGWPVEYASPNVFNIFGYSDKDFMCGRVKFAEVIHEDDLERIRQEVIHYSNSGAANFEQHYRIVRPDGEVRWLYDYTVVVRDDAGVISHYEGYVQDVTERQRAEEEKQQLQEQLLHAQKMETIGVMAGGIAHDFNNLLTPIIGSIELLMGEISDKDHLKHLRNALLCARKAESLIRQILIFSRKLKEEKKVIRLERVIKEAVMFLRATLPATVKIELNCAEDSAAVLADPIQIQQVVMNLVTNAYHAVSSAKDGIIKVSLYQQDIEEPLECVYNKLVPGRYVVISVEDNGEGIDEGLISKIFEPFFTTRKVGDGSGLGLSVVHGIVGEHRGGIQVRSKLGSGAEFKIYFPATDEECTDIKAVSMSSIGRGENVVVVDDEPKVGEIAKEMLERSGYKVTFVKEANEAIDLFKKQDLEIDLLITDQTMPGTTGLALAKKFRKFRPGKPVIITSGYSDTLTHSVLEKNNIQGYITKPYSMADFISYVRDVLDREKARSL
ncbi:MAG: PAS domain-containing hybrid sensor histidine kinase/response regulator [Candidatus Dadabacteria bacterium]|nr:MAG: PAS domain-containing hybrid sensor histidine kinase/response regulator [Candidatus Dadabacteria bacterium]